MDERCPSCRLRFHHLRKRFWVEVFLLRRKDNMGTKLLWASALASQLRQLYHTRAYIHWLLRADYSCEGCIVDIYLDRPLISLCVRQFFTWHGHPTSVITSSCQ